MPRTQQLPRRRRSLLSTVVALLVIAAAALSATAAIQIYLGRERHTVFGDVAAAAHWLGHTTWLNSGIAVWGIVLAAVGVLLVLVALLPPRRALLQLADPGPDTLAGIARRGLRRDLAGVAAAVDGVSSARVRVRRRSVRVTARSAIRDRSGLQDAVTGAVQERLDALAPARTLRVRVHLAGRKD